MGCPKIYYEAEDRLAGLFFVTMSRSRPIPVGKRKFKIQYQANLLLSPSYATQEL